MVDEGSVPSPCGLGELLVLLPVLRHWNYVASSVLFYVIHVLPGEEAHVHKYELIPYRA